MSFTFSADTPEFALLRRPAKESRQKYKTELCRNWQTGYCEFGPRCSFAHGASELRPKTEGPTACRQFAEYGYCLAGTRCQFTHEVGPSRL